MAKTSTEDVAGMVVTVGRCLDRESDLWMVTGPYWAPGGDEAAGFGPSFLIEGEADAVAAAKELAAVSEGCEIVVFPPDPIPA